jgi:regulator of replication initiation timing
VYTEEQIEKLFQNLGELYVENAKLRFKLDNIKDLPKEKPIQKFEEKLFKKEKAQPKPNPILDEQIVAIQKKLEENLK